MLALTGAELGEILSKAGEFISMPRLAIGLLGVAVIYRDKLVSLAKGILSRRTQPEPQNANALELVQQLRVLTCQEVPSVREGIAKHLDEIESLLEPKPTSGSGY